MNGLVTSTWYPQTYFNVDPNLQNVWKIEKKMKSNKYLIFLVQAYISLCAIDYMTQ